MLRRRLITSALCLACLATLLPGCGLHPRFVSAKTTERAQIMDFPRTVEWVRDDGLDAVEAGHAAALRANAFEFWAHDRMDVDVTFTSTDLVRVDLLAESINSSGSTYPDPTEISIQTTTPHRIGQTTNDGLAEIRFGAGGPVFTTQGPDTFFELEVSSVYDDNGERVASGTFSLIARNKDDASDLRRILVMDGAFILRE